MSCVLGTQGSHREGFVALGSQVPNVSSAVPLKNKTKSEICLLELCCLLELLFFWLSTLNDSAAAGAVVTVEEVFFIGINSISSRLK